MIHLHHHDRDIENPWLRARLAVLPAGALILDVGCVDGWVLDEYPTALGIDARPVPAKWANRVWRGDAEAIPYPDPDGEFDAVTCISVLEHVGLGWYGDTEGDAGKPGRVIAEMARVLRPGGWMFLTVPIDLRMTKDGRPFARPISSWMVREWLANASLVIREGLSVEADDWSAAPDDNPLDARGVFIVSAQKALP